MINYSLICKNDHKFEAWFRSYEDYNKQIDMGFLSCPYCGNQKILKALMAPAVQTSKNKKTTKNQINKTIDKKIINTNIPETSETSINNEQVRLALKLIKNYVEKNCQNVGENFAEEARKISKGQAESRNIYGKASKEEMEKLQDEGIEIASIPWVNDDA